MRSHRELAEAILACGYQVNLVMRSEPAIDATIVISCQQILLFAMGVDIPSLSRHGDIIDVGKVGDDGLTTCPPPSNDKDFKTLTSEMLDRYRQDVPPDIRREKLKKTLELLEKHLVTGSN